MKSICVFCGSSPGSKSIYQKTATDFGKYLANNNYSLVYGGAQVGVMGSIANACIKAGGEVTGVIPTFLKTKEVAHLGISKLITTDSMHERKKLLYEKSDAFVILPGGFGTLDEFFECLTWFQLGLHNKPIGLLNIESYFDPLLDFCNTMETNGFIQPAHRNFFLVNESYKSLLKEMSQFKVANSAKWMHNSSEI